MLNALRRAGVPIQRIRPAVTLLSQETGLDHALASRSVYTGGAEVIYDFQAGTSAAEIAEDFGVSLAGIQDVARHTLAA